MRSLPLLPPARPVHMALHPTKPILVVACQGADGIWELRCIHPVSGKLSDLDDSRSRLWCVSQSEAHQSGCNQPLAAINSCRLQEMSLQAAHPPGRYLFIPSRFHGCNAEKHAVHVFISRQLPSLASIKLIFTVVESHWLSCWGRQHVELHNRHNCGQLLVTSLVTIGHDKIAGDNIGHDSIGQWSDLGWGLEDLHPQELEQAYEGRPASPRHPKTVMCIHVEALNKRQCLYMLRGWKDNTTHQTHYKVSNTGLIQADQQNMCLKAHSAS